MANWLIPITGQAQFTETKEIHKQFGVAPQTRIEISNKYGKIELNTWEKDSVVIDIDIRVEEKKLSRLEKAIDDIDFDFTQSQHFLIVNTLVDRNKSDLGKELLRLKETVLQSDGNIQIDYTVWVPQRNELVVNNKFGDIYISDFEGDIKMDLSNGNLKSNDLSGRLDLTLNFGDATINKINTGRIECSFSDVYIKEAESLRLESKSTTFEILEINDLDTDSRRDKFRIRLIDRLEAVSSFSNFRITELTDRINLKAAYGDLDIEKTAPDFSDMYIESKSTDLNLYFDKGSEFNFEITHTKTENQFCTELKIEKEEVLDEKEKQGKLTGYFGKPGNNTRLNIKAEEGEINILSN